MSAKPSFTHKDFASVLNEYHYDIHLGDIVAGTIFNIEKNGFIVDIGTNIAAFLPKEEIALNKSYALSNAMLINETREFFILAYNRMNKQLILSIKRLDYIRGWERIKQLESEDIIFNVPYIASNKGGIITRIEGIQAFIPNSHLAKVDKQHGLSKTNIKCKFLIINEKINQLVFSNRLANLSLMSKQLKPGQIIEGHITNIETYGLFINIQGVNALLHISEISDDYIDNLQNYFHLGEVVKVRVLHIDTKQGRISVSRRNLNHHQQL